MEREGKYQGGGNEEGHNNPEHRTSSDPQTEVLIPNGTAYSFEPAVRSMVPVLKIDLCADALLIPGIRLKGAPPAASPHMAPQFCPLPDSCRWLSISYPSVNSIESAVGLADDGLTDWR
jgi:hypothetical protein